MIKNKDNIIIYIMKRVEFNRFLEEPIKKKIKRNYDPKINFVNLSLNIHGELNIGAMIRSSNLSGCSKFVIFGNKKYDKRSAVGAFEYLNVIKVAGNKKNILKNKLEENDYILDENILIDFIKNNNYIPIFIEQKEESIEPTNENIKQILDYSFQNSKTPLLIYGNELKGVPDNIYNIKNSFDKYYSLELSQAGNLASFNVSATCAIISYKFFEIINEYYK